jgi:hypothetical protein
MTEIPIVVWNMYCRELFGELLFHSNLYQCLWAVHSRTRQVSWPHYSTDTDIGVHPLLGDVEVSCNVMVAGHFHICCCWRSLSMHMHATVAVVQTAPQYFPCSLLFRVWSNFFIFFSLFADMLLDLKSLLPDYRVISQFYSGWLQS